MNALLSRCVDAVGADAAALEVSEPGRWLGGPLPVDDLATGAIGAALLAAADLAHARTGTRPAIALSAEHAALSFGSERHARLDGRGGGSGFAPLSRFVRCADGNWARTHGNYPHHARALAQALGFTLTDDPEANGDALQAAASRHTALGLEDAVIAAGGCAAAFRSPEDWREHPAGAAASAAPLIEWCEQLRHPAPAGAGSAAPPERATPPRPADGIRVLDLTRVIAGPVAGRTLAALGTEVLRIDPPSLSEIAAQHLDTGPGKRTATADLAADAETREALLAGADVLITGYRSGGLARLGLDPEAIAHRHPHLVHVTLSAWGQRGPWGDRRGFDSLVQVASGIAARCAAPDGTPGALPVQALDHATGHLIAAAALRSLAQRYRGEPISPARLALATTAAALLCAPKAVVQDDHTGQADATNYAIEFPFSFRGGEHTLTLIGPPGTLDGHPLAWPFGPRPLGKDPANWGSGR